MGSERLFSVVCLSECKSIYSVPFLAADQVVGVFGTFFVLVFQIRHYLSPFSQRLGGGRCVWWFVCLSVFNKTYPVLSLAADQSVRSVFGGLFV